MRSGGDDDVVGTARGGIWIDRSVQSKGFADLAFEPNAFDRAADAPADGQAESVFGEVVGAEEDGERAA